MASANDAIVYALTTSKAMLGRYTEDLSPQEMLHRPTPKANCAAWLVGHLALSDRRTLKLLGAADVPPLPDGFEHRFSREEGCPQANDFGDPSVAMRVFNEHRDALVAFLGS